MCMDRLSACGGRSSMVGWSCGHARVGGSVPLASGAERCRLASMAVTVLAVDDQAVFRNVARDLVASTEGFELVGAAESGEEALSLAERLHPDLVLLDV